MISKLIDKIQKTNAPIVVGLDPKLDFIPDRIKDKCFEEKGKNLEGAAEAFWQYNKEIVDSIYDIVPAVKPQIAMYEELGIPGLITYKKTVDYCKEYEQACGSEGVMESHFCRIAVSRTDDQVHDDKRQHQEVSVDLRCHERQEEQREHHLKEEDH